jgi:heptosyltransferase-2/heptosyltransferase-3
MHEREIRPLVVRFGALGDSIILLGLIEALQRRFGTPVDIVSSGAWTRPLFEGQPAVGRLHLIRSRRTPYAMSPLQWRLVRELRGRPAGPVWLCDGEKQALSLLRRAGIAGPWIANIADCPRLPGEHHFDRLRRFAQLSPAALPPMTHEAAARLVEGIQAPPITILPAWRTDVDAWLRTMGVTGRPLVLVQVGNKRTMRWWVTHRRARNTKYWPEARWAAMIQSLLQRHPDAVVLLLGVPVEARLNETIRQQVHSDRLFNVAPQMTVPRLLALQERALGMVSVDTGPAHSAGALGCPLVVLFGKADVQAYTPRSTRGAVQVLASRDDEGKGSMLGISVEDVLGAWERLHANPSPNAVGAAPTHTALAQHVIGGRA